MNPFSLVNKTVLITGASSGLGKHFATIFAKAGARVAIAGRRHGALQQLVAEIQKSGSEAKAFEMDVTNTQSVSACFDSLAEWYVPSVVINNAGVTITKPILKHSEADWDNVMDTNLKGAWLVATEAARRMLDLEIEGNIVNTSSILGERVAGM